MLQRVAPASTTGIEIETVLAAMTAHEKILLLEGVGSWRTNAIPRLGVPALFVTDGPHGVRRVRDDAGAFGLADAVPSSSFPTAATVANTWDPDNARRVGAAIARECIARDVDVLLAPGVNIKRSPLCGRNFEYYSEDPLVAGTFGSAFVQAVEGVGVGTSVKHFAANSNDDYRFVGDSIVDERALREIYLPAFERVVTTAKPSTVMCAYNAVNGIPSSDNASLLTDILRGEWGFDGVVMTDWGATHDRVVALNAGCELDMPGEVRHTREQLRRALADGRLTTDTLDEAVRRMLRLIDRCTTGTRSAAVDEDTHAAVARDVAVEGAVLLTNDGTLPLDPREDSLLIVGEMFEKMRFQGAGSSLVNPPAIISPRDAFDRRGITYRYERGYRAVATHPDAAMMDAAVRSVRPGDTVLFFGGLNDLEESEGFDRTSMALGSAQTTLLRRLIDTGAKVVLVLFAGAPVELGFADELAAILDMYLPGMAGGEATAALLLGEATPSGKLTESWPATAADSSCAADYGRSRVSQYYESIYVGYRFYDKAQTPVRFAFGHGLSYTTFGYSDLSVRTTGDHVEATVTITNTGHRAGAEAVQLYVRNNDGAVFKADKELRAFEKVRLDAGESRTITLAFALRDLSYWDVREHEWVLENGDYAVLIAASAADVRLEAPLTVSEGRASRSPYAAAVDEAYAAPPRVIPRAFTEIAGVPVPRPRRSRRLTLETRLVDARGSIMGWVMYTAVTARIHREYRAALRMTDSPERDSRVKHTHFLVRMMPTISLRAMVMSSGGVFPHHIAAAIADIAAFRPLRGLRRIITGGRIAREDRTV